MPHWLCRLPYGAETEPVESFALEEVIGIGADDLLWANPAFSVALVAAEAFALAGWSLDLSRGVARLEGLPLYVHEQDGAPVTAPCGEVLLSDRMVEILEDLGFIPLVTERDRDAVALPCMRALGVPRAPLRIG